MSFRLYRGLWPQNVSKLAKYGVRFFEKDWKVTVWCDLGDGMRYFAVEGGDHDLAERVNAVKRGIQAQPGGVFYINEYRHVLVPVAQGGTSEYYYAGRFDHDLSFDFEGDSLTTRPLGADGQELHPGDTWVGPRPGIPYVLAAGAADIHYETPALTEGDPPAVRPRTTRKVKLSAVLNDRTRLARAVKPVADVRGHSGGRFYVNEHGAMFSPVDNGDGNGLNYIYCGTIERENWFPEPPVA